MKNEISSLPITKFIEIVLGKTTTEAQKLIIEEMEKRKKPFVIVRRPRHWSKW